MAVASFAASESLWEPGSHSQRCSAASDCVTTDHMRTIRKEHTHLLGSHYEEG